MHTDSAAVVAEGYSEKSDRYFGNSGCSLSFPGNDCMIAFGWGHLWGMAWSCWHYKHFVKEEEDTGCWGEEGEGEEVSLRWLGSGVAEEWQEEGVVVERGSLGTGLPSQELGEAIKKKERNTISFYIIHEDKKHI